MIATVVVLAIFMSILKPGSLFAGPTDNVTGWAWSGVAGGGWISLNCTNDASCSTVDYGVRIDEASGAWSGSGWSSNVGWVDFNSSSCGSGPVTDMNSGVTTGFAKVRAGGTGGFTGCINMAGNGPSASGGVIVDVNPTSPTYGQMSGFAWSGDDVVANIDNTPANEWVTNGIADVGLGWIDFAQAFAELEDEEIADVTLYVDGQCNSEDPVEFSWSLDNVDTDSCELYVVDPVDGGQTIISTTDINGDAFDVVNNEPFQKLVAGPAGTNIGFQLACDNLEGDVIESSVVQLSCEGELVYQCNDGIDNDGDGLVDIDDPQCHTDCDASNPASYNPYDDNEGGSCLDPANNPNSPLNQTDGQAPIYIES